MGLFLKHLLQLIIAPHAGWEDISAADKSVRFWLEKGFYPLLGVTALSCFMSFFYHHDSTIGICLQNSLTTFVSFFATYFIAGLVFSSFMDRIIVLPDDTELTRLGVMSRFNIVSIFILSLMALITLIENLLPFDLSVIKFLQFYVLFVLYRASDFAGVPQERIGIFTLIGAFCIFIPPMAVYWWFSTYFVR